MATRAQPRLLGYECHEVLASRSGAYDWYCYLEDDLLIRDPLFFEKLRWFRSWAPADSVLQPNRFEVSIEPLPHSRGVRAYKTYIDGPPAQQALSEPFQDVDARPDLRRNFLCSELLLRKTHNPHSGCFFLSREQLAGWFSVSGAREHASDFAGPLESAATLGIMRAFDVYKPARENASFLEIQHLDRRYTVTTGRGDGQPRVGLRSRS